MKTLTSSKAQEKTRVGLSSDSHLKTMSRSNNISKQVKKGTVRERTIIGSFLNKCRQSIQIANLDCRLTVYWLKNVSRMNFNMVTYPIIWNIGKNGAGILKSIEFISRFQSSCLSENMEWYNFWKDGLLPRSRWRSVVPVIFS